MELLDNREYQKMSIVDETHQSWKKKSLKKDIILALVSK